MHNHHSRRRTDQFPDLLVSRIILTILVAAFLIQVGFSVGSLTTLIANVGLIVIVLFCGVMLINNPPDISHTRSRSTTILANLLIVTMVTFTTIALAINFFRPLG